jgi:radical SAM-linked protein
MRIRASFSKHKSMQFTGHLDLFRAWERWIRRAGLPLMYSQGYKSHPKINLACALPLGFTSQAEVVDFTLEHDLPIEEIQTALIRSAPPGLTITNLEIIHQAHPPLQMQVIANEYYVTLLDHHPDLANEIQQLLQSTSLPRQRRGRDYDLRPLIIECETVQQNSLEKAQIRLVLSAREGATGRPEEVMLQIGISPASARYHRSRLIMATLPPGGNAG